MHKVGDPIDGYCSKCRRNVFMSIGATDGREIFATICRTCQTTQDYRPEVSNEVIREQAMKKLQRATARKRKVSFSHGPDVISRGRRGDDAPMTESAPLARPVAARSAESAAATPAPSSPAAAEAIAPRPMGGALSPVPPARRGISAVDAPAPDRRRSGASSGSLSMSMPPRKSDAPPPPAAVESDVTQLWRAKTAELGPRDGKVYNADRTYQVGDVLLHKRYGMGIVESIVHESAITVLFRDQRQVIEMATPQ